MDKPKILHRDFLTYFWMDKQKTRPREHLYAHAHPCKIFLTLTQKTLFVRAWKCARQFFWNQKVIKMNLLNILIMFISPTQSFLRTFEKRFPSKQETPEEVKPKIVLGHAKKHCSKVFERSAKIGSCISTVSKTTHHSHGMWGKRKNRSVSGVPGFYYRARAQNSGLDIGHWLRLGNWDSRAWASKSQFSGLRSGLIFRARVSGLVFPDSKFRVFI